MENQSQNQGASQGDDFAGINKMFSNYYDKPDNGSGNDGKPKLTKEQKLARYFVPRNDEEIFRVLPALKGHDIEEFAFFHQAEVNNPTKTNGKQWKKIYCAAHNSPKVPKLDPSGQEIKDIEGNPVLVLEKCPFCEKANAIEAKLDTSFKWTKKVDMTPAQLVINDKNTEIRKEAYKYKANKFYLIRGIDQGKPKDGIKYWRIKHNFKKQGAYDKIVGAFKQFFSNFNIDPTNPNNGCNLIVNVFDNQTPNGRPYRDVSSIQSSIQTPIHSDSVVANQWLADTTTWRDVFKPAGMTRVINSYEYLERVIKGTDPYWDESDQKNKRFVFPDPADADLMVKANTRDESLDSQTEGNDGNANIERASDIVEQSMDNVDISNVTKEDVGTFKDNTVNVTAGFKTEPQQQAPVVQQQPVNQTPVVNQQAPVVQQQPVVTNTPTENVADESSEYDDLPF